MRFFHVGDLHFGKMLHNVPLVEADQPYWVEQFIQAVDQYQADAVVIAGDVYDRRVPSPEAMQLFDHLLVELAKRDKYVFVIPGNHDSAIRLSHVNELLASHKIFICGEVERELMHVTVPGNAGADVTFWLMPYIFPKLVAAPSVLDDPDLSTYDLAARELINAQEIDKDACNVLVAHQNVLANGVSPEHSESETLIGGIGEIEFSAFDAFDYVALGHIHNAQKVGRETVRYSGCPLYYDFSETNRSKDLTLVTINSKDDIRVEKIEIPLLHRLLQKTGSLDELVKEGLSLADKEKYYIQCILSDRHIPPRALEQLRDVYGAQLINVKRSPLGAAPSSSSANIPGEEKERAMTVGEQFGLFFQEQNQDELLDDSQEGLIQTILEQQSREGGDYILDSKQVPMKDSEELLEYLVDAVSKVSSVTAASAASSAGTVSSTGAVSLASSASATSSADIANSPTAASLPATQEENR